MPPPALIYFFGFAFGTIFGSFLNVCIVRIPEERSVVGPRSHCPQCSALIAWYDNVPLLSFLFLGGRCRHCKGRISFVYPLVEWISGLLAMLCLWKFQFSPKAALWFFSFVCPLIVISFIDLKHFIIPDVISLPFIGIGILARLANENFLHPWNSIYDSFLGIVLGAGALWFIAKAYELLRKQEGLGMGDVKLMAMIGAFLGWKAIFFVFLFSSLFASIFGILLMIFSRFRLQSALPYGPFIALGALLYLFTGTEILRAYFSAMRHFFH